MEANGGKFKLRDLLSVPMQRILKYEILLRELLKHTMQVRSGSVLARIGAIEAVWDYVTCNCRPFMGNRHILWALFGELAFQLDILEAIVVRSMIDDVSRINNLMLMVDLAN